MFLAWSLTPDLSFWKTANILSTCKLEVPDTRTNTVNAYSGPNECQQYDDVGTTFFSLSPYVSDLVASLR